MSESGKTRGIENPISTDMCLIGDTKQELHTKSLPRLTGPNFGGGGSKPSDEYRVSGGTEQKDK